VIKEIKPLFICLAGTLLEWYDFSLFAALAPVLSELFFPLRNHTASLLATFMTFAAGFLARPIGALYLGNLGDKLGRKSSLFITVTLMTVATVSIGLLPTYAQIGITAPILLVVLRLLQGLAVSGEYSGAITFLSELAEPGRKGFVASFTITGAAGGMVLGSLVSLVVSHILSHAALLNWGWRLPFIGSIVLGGVGLYMRAKLTESPAFLALLQGKGVNKFPLLSLLKYNVSGVFKTIAIFCANLIVFYTIFVYMPASLLATKKISLTLMLAINSCSLATMMFFIPIFGYLSDKFGKRAILNIGAITTIILSYPLFSLYQYPSGVFILLAQMSFALLASCYVASVPAVISNLFPTELRYCGIALGVNLATALFGGTTPVVAAYLAYIAHNNSLVCGYIVLSAIVSLATIYFIKVL
jgi:MHS family proline/betaine transporter-like MFS transporter